MSPPRAFVAGWPVSHSRSPLIHRFWLGRYRIAGDYVRQPVAPEAIDAFLHDLAGRGFVGGNVTLPHKEAAFRACRTLTEVARRLGAANTLWLEEDGLAGDNTDVYGFIANLDEQAPGWRGGRVAVVMGAGGASRAVVEALRLAEYKAVHLLNRTRARAEALAGHFGASILPGGLEEIEALLPHADLIVNATSSGLSGQAEFRFDLSRARPEAVATDLVYVPLLTPFLAEAARCGLRTVDGLGMLMHQAAPGFERWFGVRPSVDAELRALLIADLGGG